ncbi:uncharacterized protein LOC132272597 [Cornus florida]|uniref:uncharacterized protein LOC132272597 n=1 Tax=Cornus florida TaxID=4283 RepID=UPI0028A21A5F|nr:uncharacterized protein LOC132272597 [Cornus florida]
MKFAAPQPIKQPLEQRDKNKHCAYHRDYGYTTNDCRSLRRQVENMIMRGELADYLTTKEYMKPREVNHRKVEGNQVKVIHAIHGDRRMIKSQRRKSQYWVRQWRSILSSTSHEDPLVISLLVANCMIKRVLIYLGSSANIITKAVFEQLKILSSSIQPTSSPLMGFDSTKVDPLQVINLFVTAAKRTLRENFILIEIHPSYNLIMGRGWIHRMNGVPSTLHQVMRCLSLDGKEVIDLRGDQFAAKEYYMLAQNEAKKNLLPRYLKAEDETEVTKPTEESLEAVEVILGFP